jgi:hypothetical protein
LSYHLKFSSDCFIASSTWQNDINKAESDVYSSALGKAAVAAASYSNYKEVVVWTKRLFSRRDCYGRVVLGRYDGNYKANFFPVGKIVNGQAVINDSWWWRRNWTVFFS